MIDHNQSMVQEKPKKKKKMKGKLVHEKTVYTC